ncbi:complement factor H-like isoform X2 [Siniperca chuatsi]|uniref:complement factor H-like isoform X2 n=1 Tax=Siniperca chuatsi TaxID=119488 RepID=UPI001CE063DE|nr:complement factor H-like isoform X2 [Siniperca chuatsi]
MHVITQSCVLFLWMHTLTFVKSQDCTLEQFINGPLYDLNFDTTDLEASYVGGKQVRVGCTVGYSGFFKLICVEGKWQSRGNKCQPRSCGHPGDAQFSDFHLEKGDDFVFGSQVVYTCHKGYQMVSRTNYRRCMAEGWDGVVPVCEAQQCPGILVDINVQVNGDPEEATYGNVVRFSCKSSNEILIGSSEIYCDENGDWSAEAPKCKEIKCTVPMIQNGYVPGDIQEYKEHEVLHFECNPQYKRAEDRPSKCTKLGIRADWTPTPVCEQIKCRLPPTLEGTRYEPAFRNVFSPGDTLRVICGEKYWISNHQTKSALARCKDDGQWTVRPVCQEVKCRIPEDPLVVYWYNNWRQQIKLDETVSYQCRSGYKRTDGVTRATCARDGWRPNPLCEEIICDKQDIPNADIVTDKQKYKYNEQAEYVCRVGYRGRPTRTCTESGWTGRSQCTEITCSRQDYPNADIYGNVQSIYMYKEQVEYTCKKGGQFTLTCGETGWIGSPECTKCSKPNVPNGFVVGPYNDTVYYTCNEGYKLFTKGWWSEAKCNDGVWSGLERCIEIRKCREPVIPNSKVTPQDNVYEHKDSVKIICEEGYRAQVDSLTCHEGKWHPNKPLKTICTPIANLCSSPPKVDNAVAVTSYKKEFLSHSAVTYQCRDNYTMEGEDTIRCKNGKWEEKNITCTLSGTATESGAVAGLPSSPNNVTEDGRPVSGTATESGAVAGLPSSPNNVTEDGRPVKPCELPDDTPNGYYHIIHGEDFVFGTTIKYFCNEGYQMVSKDDTRTCLLDKWTNHIPICDPLSCDPPPADGGLIVKGLPENEESILPDRFLTFSCDGPGKYLNGSSVLICGKDGQWDNPFPSCEDITCKVGVMPLHLTVTGLPPANETMKIGHKLWFRCDDQYALEGSDGTECLQTGQWNAPFPTCHEKCNVTGVPANVRITTYVPNNQLRKGQNLRFACRKRGDTLRGRASVECLANGQWSDPFPTCGAPLGCGKPPVPANGDTKESVRFRYLHNERVEYICQRWHVMEGEPYKTCNNGEWIGQMKCLKPCTVNRETMKKHNITFRYTRYDKLYSEHSDEIEFVCIRGTRHDGSVNMRQRCVDGVMLLPTCQ